MAYFNTAQVTPSNWTMPKLKEATQLPLSWQKFSGTILESWTTQPQQKGITKYVLSITLH